MAPRDDLGSLYARNMEHFGCGVGMFQPVSSSNMRPPCVGYVDHNRNWNWIANVEWPGYKESSNVNDFLPLKRKPAKMEQLGIEWRPRTSRGVRQWNVDATGQTADIGLPVGADGHIQYKSDTDFGAVLIAQKPITLTSYNDETLFQAWLRINRARLCSLYGTELRRYGLWLVTTTYTSPRASINAWQDKDKDADMGVKVKANAVGDLGGDLDWVDKTTDKDWSHYTGTGHGDTVVLFYNGIEVPSWEWWWEGVKVSIGGPRRGSVPEIQAEGRPPPTQSAEQQANLSSGNVPSHRIQLTPETPLLDTDLSEEDLWGSEAALRRKSLTVSRSVSRGRQPSTRVASSLRQTSTPAGLSKYLSPEEQPRSFDRLAVTPPSTQRFSTASTAASSSSDRHHELNGTGLETTPPTSIGRRSRSLRRKGSSPALRNPS